MANVADDLARYRESAEVGSIIIDGREMIRIEWSSGSWTRRMVLDPHMNLAPIEIESRMDSPQSLREMAGFERSVYRHLFRTSREYGGTFVPVEVDIEGFVELSDGSQLPVMRQKIRGVQVDEQTHEFDPDTFTIKFPMGTDVTLVDIGTSYIVGGDPHDMSDISETQLRPSDEQPTGASSNRQGRRMGEENGQQAKSESAIMEPITGGTRTMIVVLVVLASAGTGLLLLFRALRRRRQ